MSKHKKDPATWKKFNRQRHPTDHIDRCESGYLVPKENQVHHILPISAAQDSTMPKDGKLYIRSCMKITEWDIDDAHNTVGLPVKKAYYKYEKKKIKPPVVAWNGHPCHMIDHDIYLNQIILYVQQTVWNPLKEAKAKDDCAKVDAKSIRSELCSVSRVYRRYLASRGMAVGGTKYCWDNRNLPALAATWFIPFSMGTPPRPRSPIPASLKGKMADVLKTLFLKLKGP